MFTSFKQFDGWWSQEIETTRRVLSALPDSGLGYKPDVKSRSAGELAWHLVTAPRWFVGEVLKLALKGDVGKTPDKSAGFLKAFDQTSQACRAAIQAQGDGWFTQTTDFLGRTLPNGVILSMMLFHDVHHRGQLSVYLRPVGAKVPSIYGPSADAEMQAASAPKKEKVKAKR